MSAIYRRACGFVSLTAGFVLLLGGSVAWGDHIPPPDPPRCAVSDCGESSGGSNEDQQDDDQQDEGSERSASEAEQPSDDEAAGHSDDSEHQSGAASDEPQDDSGADESSGGSSATATTAQRSRSGGAGASNPESARAAKAQDQSESVNIGDDFFDPRELTIEVGTTVTWTNNGQNPHTVSADDGSFESGADQQDWIQPGESFSHTFDSAAGDFPYHCRLHGGPGGAGHSGVITVTSADDDTSADDENGDEQDSTTAADTGGTGSDDSAGGTGSENQASGSGGAADANGTGTGGLAQTGAEHLAFAGAGVALIAVGGALLLVPRPRRSASETGPTDDQA